MTADVSIDDIRSLLAMQAEHEVIARIELADAAPSSDGTFTVSVGGVLQQMTGAQIWEAYETRKNWIKGADEDHFEHGVRYPAWDDIYWELARLRVEHPGEPIEFLVAGANGSAKTYFAAELLVSAMMQAPKSGADWQRMFWTLALDEQASETVQQKAVYYWLPNEYKPDSGAVKTTARRKLRFNQSGGFTDNQFSLDNGAQMQGRFWSKDITTLEGVRPCFVWSDEGVPVAWLEGATNRLVSAAGRTRALCPKWDRLLREKAQNPDLRFPREFLYELVLGVHLVSYTFRNGYTETVQAFSGKAVREIEADPELLPVHDAKGKVVGGERMPKLVKCDKPKRRAFYLHAWDNPIGGNWQGLRSRAMDRNRTDKLWMCYGVAESKADSPFSNFDERMHVIPRVWLPSVGTLAHAADSLAYGGRTWFQLWGLIVGDYHRCFWPGDLIIVHEYPQTDDVIPGMGLGEVWAEPGGKDGKGKPGPAQRSWPVGHQFRADEIRRIETKLCGWFGWPVPQAAEWNIETPWTVVPRGYRMMDSRQGNVATSTSGGAETLITTMRGMGLHFVRWGMDTGAVEGSTRVKAGEQMINNALWFDRKLAVLDEGNGRLGIDPKRGKGPRIWICEHCTNLIEALKNYPGIAVGDSAWKDPIDCLRALVIANLRYLDPDLSLVDDNSHLFSGSGTFLDPITPQDHELSTHPEAPPRF